MLHKKIKNVVLGILMAIGLCGVAAPVMADPSTFIFATDGDHHLIRQYDIQGNEIGQIQNQELFFPTLLTADASTGTLVTDINFTGLDGPDLVRIGLNGTIVARNSSAAIFGMRGGGVVDVIPSRRGTFFVTSTLNTSIAEVGQNLQVIRRFASGALAGYLRILGGATSLDGTKLFIADAAAQSGSGFIRIYDTFTGAQIGSITDPAIEFPIDVEFDSRGLMYVTDRGADFISGRILVFDQSLALINEFSAGAPADFNFGAFAILPDNNLVVLETNATADTAIRVIGSAGQFLSRFGDGLKNSSGIAVMRLLENDSDRDGISDPQDSCPNSIRSSTVKLGNCDSGIPNILFPNGCTISDKVQACADGASNHGEFVSRIASLIDELYRTGVITSQQKGEIQRCAAQANLP